MSRVLRHKAVFALILGLFLVVSVGGVFTAETMNGGTADNCPYMGAPALCAMSPLDHLSQWQQTFAAVVQSAAAGVLLLLALYAGFLLATGQRLPQPRATGACRYRAPPSTSQSKKITRWLSLFELSPSPV